MKDKLDLFVLHLSFIGWHLLEAFTLGIAALYVRPYLNTAEAVFYDRLAEKQGRPVSASPHAYTTREDEDGFADF